MIGSLAVVAVCVVFAVECHAAGLPNEYCCLKIIEPFPGSHLQQEKSFHLKLDLLILDERITAPAVRFNISFNDKQFKLLDIHGVEHLRLHPVSAPADHSLAVSVFDADNGLKLLCEQNAKYPSKYVASVARTIRMSLSSNNKYAERFFIDFIESVVPHATVEVIDLKTEIENSHLRLLHNQSFPTIDIMLVGPLDMFDSAPGSTWIGAVDLIRQLCVALRPRTVWVINGEGLRLNNLVFASSLISAASERTLGIVDAVFSTTTGPLAVPLGSDRPMDLQPLFIYLPTAAGSFYEMKDKSPSLLLNAAGRRPELAAVSSIPKREIAYVYSRCLHHRESFYARLKSAFETEDANQVGIGTTNRVEALGSCQGAGTPRDTSRERGRLSEHYVEDAIRLYSNYKFVIAFENCAMDGYITEKLTNAFLAGAVPVYWGAPDVHRYFSADAMINCNSISETECVEAILIVSRNDSRYDEMRLTAPMNTSQWELFFEPLPSINKEGIKNKYSSRFDKLLSDKHNDANFDAIQGS